MPKRAGGPALGLLAQVARGARDLSRAELGEREAREQVGIPRRQLDGVREIGRASCRERV